MNPGKLTIIVESELFNGIYNNPKESLEYLKSNNLFMTLSEGIKKELYNKGYSGTEEQLFCVFYEILQDHGVAPARATAKSWFFDDANLSRDNAIKICFAFELSPIDATNFLNKACFKSDFNFRNAIEIICNYCLKNKKIYSDAQKIYKKYCELLPSPNIEEEASTIIIREKFIDFPDNDDAFLKLLQSMKNELTGFSETAYKWYNMLKQQLVEQVENDPDFIRQEAEKQKYPNQNIDNARLVRSLYLGLPVRNFDRAQKEVDFFKPKESEISKIVEKIPVDWNLSEFDRKKKAVPRELLILFKFFCVFYAFDKKETPPDYYNQFCTDIDGILASCGMGGLYSRNPFDWFIMSSAEKEHPVDYLNEILELSFGQTNKI